MTATDLATSESSWKNPKAVAETEMTGLVSTVCVGVRLCCTLFFSLAITPRPRSLPLYAPAASEVYKGPIKHNEWGVASKLQRYALDGLAGHGDDVWGGREFRCYLTGSH